MNTPTQLVAAVIFGVLVIESLPIRPTAKDPNAEDDWLNAIIRIVLFIWAVRVLQGL
jgi:hypothetical protein